MCIQDLVEGLSLPPTTEQAKEKGGLTLHPGCIEAGQADQKRRAGRSDVQGGPGNPREGSHQDPSRHCKAAEKRAEISEETSLGSDPNAPAVLAACVTSYLLVRTVKNEKQSYCYKFETWFCALWVTRSDVYIFYQGHSM